MFLEQVVWVVGSYLAATGLLAILMHKVAGPPWWVLPLFLTASACAAAFRDMSGDSATSVRPSAHDSDVTPR
ncbi:MULTISPECIES: hypothetical protein [unclassified Sphingomonas]|uniref:hypothetical protein n=1 Tax=Sphingomonas sp. PvP015 TaxID=3156388 RepID=UPI00339783FF